MRRLRREGGRDHRERSKASEGGTRWGHHRNGTRSAIGTCICRIAHDFESTIPSTSLPFHLSLTSPHLALPHPTSHFDTAAAPPPGCIASHHHNKRLPGRHAYIAVVSLVCPNLWAERGCLPRALPCPAYYLLLPPHSFSLPTPYSIAAHSAHEHPRLIVRRRLDRFLCHAAPRRIGFDLRRSAGRWPCPHISLPCRWPLLATRCSNARLGG